MSDIPTPFRGQKCESPKMPIPATGYFVMVCDGVGENNSNSLLKSHLRLDPSIDATPMGVCSSRWMGQVCKEIVDRPEFAVKYEAVTTLEELLYSYNNK